MPLPEFSPRLRRVHHAGMLGLLVGDALGVPYEFTPPRERESVEWRGHGTYNQPIGTYSDDGGLALALYAGIREPGELSPAHIAANFIAWLREGAFMADSGPPFDVGNTTAQAISNLTYGVQPEDAGPADPDCNSANGSLMRILPMALWFYDLPDDELLAHTDIAGRITHGAPLCRATCAVYTIIAADFVRARMAAPAGDEFGDEAAQTLGWQHLLTRAEAVAKRFYTGVDGDVADAVVQLMDSKFRTMGNGSGFVVDAFWSAWQSVTVTDNYADAVKHAVHFGNDTDTTAAIAGGLAGLRHGLDAIPKIWREQLRLNAKVKALLNV